MTTSSHGVGCEADLCCLSAIRVLSRMLERDRTGSPNKPGGSGKGIRHKLRAEETIGINRSRQFKPRHMRALKPETGVIAGIADQNHAAMANVRRASKAMPHQCAAKAARTKSRINSNRSQHQCRHTASIDVPEAQGSHEAIICSRYERKAIGRQPTFAQALAGLGEAIQPERAIEQMFPIGNIKQFFSVNKGHRFGPLGNKMREPSHHERAL